MKRILFLDFETNGLDMDNMQIIEFGGLITDENYNIIKTISILINSCEINEHITRLTCITNDMLKSYGMNKEAGYDTIKILCSEADYIVAHNGNKFDFPILDKFYKKQDHQIYVDTMTDLPIDYPTRKLMYLCAEYGIVLNQAHRAVNDVFAMYHLLCKLKFQDIIDNITQPKYKVLCAISYKQMMAIPEDDRPSTKKGFSYNNVDKSWSKIVRENETAEYKKFSFYKLSIV